MNFKYIGILEPKIAEKLNIPEHKNKPILVYKNKIEHVIDYNLKAFESINNIMFVYENLNKIIKKPDYCFFNSNNNLLEYYKNLNDYVCVVVTISLGKVLKVQSWFPANTNKIYNRLRKEDKKQLYIN